MAGISIVLAEFLACILNQRLNFVKMSLVLMVLVLSVLSWLQSIVWRTNMTLWSHAVKVSPESSYALGFLGMTYLKQGDSMQALPLLERAAKNPFNSQAQLALKYAKVKVRSQLHKKTKETR